LFDWQVSHLDAHPLFERLPEEDYKNDECYKAILTMTDEAKKVDRLGGSKFAAVYRRVAPSNKKAK